MYECGELQLGIVQRDGQTDSVLAELHLLP